MMFMCPVESDIAIAIQLPSARASGAAANATQIASDAATAARFVIGFPTLFPVRCAVDRGLSLSRRRAPARRHIGKLSQREDFTQ
ncbi:hypothetical protein AWB93_07140 [Mycobacterium bohemicum]|uniref:Uncharacterized protein n=1 Tax=Mycobacterium bohemicum TaxID=56425 RepID=A0A1X1R8R1_MYCBE|nr:hypothetical protein AWB93_07140 [Mycobacterium bohemicum]